MNRPKVTAALTQALGLICAAFLLHPDSVHASSDEGAGALARRVLSPPVRWSEAALDFQRGDDQPELVRDAGELARRFILGSGGLQTGQRASIASPALGSGPVQLPEPSRHDMDAHVLIRRTILGERV